MYRALCPERSVPQEGCRLNFRVQGLGFRVLILRNIP